jgi:hypothetical protein
MGNKSVVETFDALGLSRTHKDRIEALNLLSPDYEIEGDKMTFDSNMELNQKVKELLKQKSNESEKEAIQNLRTLIASDSNIKENQEKSQEKSKLKVNSVSTTS